MNADRRSGGTADLRILAIAGSLRRESFNRRLLDAVARLAPHGMSIDVYDGLDAVPLFNEDLEGPPEPPGVERLRAAVARADGLMIATPEYNQALPGVVKNFVDWLSRADGSALDGRPVAILGVTAGGWGTRLAQASLRHSLAACGAIVMPTPQVYLRLAAQLFDEQQRLVDPRVRESLAEFAESFQRWVRATCMQIERKTP
jgi:chromate reductase, NAD(P)H dehydrogenase (quinone)